ncbi:hypothetical protein BKA70DRAFT_1219736 [Coprinopsis sp. MPI-PUGE-AT-0042]|nr:hypothetical protein BKA70DRAFT_1219736 [Coprinopsis sp. MPI-PUGE-AT-0042]
MTSPPVLIERPKERRAESSATVVQSCRQISAENMHEATSLEMGDQRILTVTFFAEDAPVELSDTLSASTASRSSLPVGLLSESVAPPFPPTPSAFPTPINGPLNPTGHEEWLQIIIQGQCNQISELQAQIQTYRRRCFCYRTKAVAVKALYAQQQTLLEQTMASLVHLQHNRSRQPSVFGLSSTSEFINDNFVLGSLGNDPFF